jgi:hypothetical protein
MYFIDEPARMSEAAAVGATVTYLDRPKCGFFADIDAKALAAG